METPKKPYILLGTPTTVGELKNLLQNYPEETDFGFRNQPLQQLVEVTYNEKRHVCFTEIPPLLENKGGLVIETWPGYIMDIISDVVNNSSKRVSKR